jgi:hypothetical protein
MCMMISVTWNWKDGEETWRTEKNRSGLFRRPQHALSCSAGGKRNASKHRNHIGNIVTDWALARWWRGKHVPTSPYPTIERRPLIGNRPVNTHHSNECATIERLFSVAFAPRSYLKKMDVREVSWGFTCGVLTSGQRKWNNLSC